jgi:hypothetical protein
MEALKYYHKYFLVPQLRTLPRPSQPSRSRYLAHDGNMNEINAVTRDIIINEQRIQDGKAPRRALQANGFINAGLNLRKKPERLLRSISS